MPAGGACWGAGPARGEGVAGGGRAGGGRGRGAGGALRSSLPGRGARAPPARGPGCGSTGRRPSRLQSGRPAPCECLQVGSGRKPPELPCSPLIELPSRPGDCAPTLPSRLPCGQSPPGSAERLCQGWASTPVAPAPSPPRPGPGGVSKVLMGCVAGLACRVPLETRKARGEGPRLCHLQKRKKRRKVLCKTQLRFCLVLYPVGSVADIYNNHRRLLGKHMGGSGI